MTQNHSLFPGTKQRLLWECILAWGLEQGRGSWGQCQGSSQPPPDHRLLSADLLHPTPSQPRTLPFHCNESSSLWYSVFPSHFSTFSCSFAPSFPLTLPLSSLSPCHQSLSTNFLMTVLGPGDTPGTKERGSHPHGVSILIEETDGKQMIIENISKYDCGCGGCYQRKVQDT